MYLNSVRLHVLKSIQHEAHQRIFSLHQCPGRTMIRFDPTAPQCFLNEVTFNIIGVSGTILVIMSNVSEHYPKQFPQL